MHGSDADRLILVLDGLAELRDQTAEITAGSAGLSAEPIEQRGRFSFSERDEAGHHAREREDAGDSLTLTLWEPSAGGGARLSSGRNERPINVRKLHAG